MKTSEQHVNEVIYIYLAVHFVSKLKNLPCLTISLYSYTECLNEQVLSPIQSLFFFLEWGGISLTLKMYLTFRKTTSMATNPYIVAVQITELTVKTVEVKLSSFKYIYQSY